MTVQIELSAGFQIEDQLAFVSQLVILTIFFILKISIPELQQNLLASSPLKLQAKLLDYN
jgi:hypothetical protein